MTSHRRRGGIQSTKSSGFYRKGVPLFLLGQKGGYLKKKWEGKKARMDVVGLARIEGGDCGGRSREKKPLGESWGPKNC